MKDAETTFSEIGLESIRIQDVAVCLVLAMGIAGCTKTEPDSIASNANSAEYREHQPAEATWHEQVAAVDSGKSNSIAISSRAVSRNDLSQIVGRVKLSELLLDAGRVTDDEMPIIASLIHLTHLRLRESPITDVGLKQIAVALPELRVLNLPQATITSKGIHELRKLSKLSHLRLAGRQLDDQAIEAISQIESLQSLHLIGPSLTDAALKSIANMKSLESFYLDDCPLSDAAWTELFDKSSIHVHIDQQHHDRDPAPKH